MAGPAAVGKPVVQPPSHTGTGGGKAPGKPGNVTANATRGVPPALLSLATGGPLTPAAYWNAAKALAAAQVNGPNTELQQQINQNNQQTQNALNLTGGYFNQLGGLMNQSLTDEGNIANQTSGQLKALGQGTQDQLGGITANAQAALNKYTPQADLGLASPGQQALIAEGARQQGLAAQNSGAAQTLGTLQGGNYGGLAASNLGTGALAGQQELANIATAGQLKNEPLTAKQAALLASRGALTTDAFGKLVQQGINNQIAAQGLGIKSAEFNATLKNDALNRQQALEVARLAQKGEWKRAMAIINGENNRALLAQQGANQRAQITQQGENARNAASIAARQALQAAKNAQATGGAKPLTTLEQNRVFGQLNRIQSLIKDAQAQGTDSTGQKLTPQLIWRHLQDGNNPAKYAYPRALIAAAFNLNRYGYITPQQAQALRRMGLQPADHGLTIKQSPVAGAVGSAGNGISAPGGSVF